MSYEYLLEESFIHIPVWWSAVGDHDTILHSLSLHPDTRNSLSGTLFNMDLRTNDAMFVTYSEIPPLSPKSLLLEQAIPLNCGSSLTKFLKCQLRLKIVYTLWAKCDNFLGHTDYSPYSFHWYIGTKILQRYLAYSPAFFCFHLFHTYCGFPYLPWN